MGGKMFKLQFPAQCAEPIRYEPGLKSMGYWVVSSTMFASIVGKNVTGRYPMA